MRRAMGFLVLLLMACQAASGLFIVRPATRPKSGPFPKATEVAGPSLGLEQVAGLPDPGAGAGFSLRLHPASELYVGDLVSLEVIPSSGTEVSNQQVWIQVDPPHGPVLGPVKFQPFGIAGRLQATLQWGWDTAGLQPGLHTLAVSVQPEGAAWTETVWLSAAAQRPLSERAARWAQARSDCCRVLYLTATAAERDLPRLLDTVDAQAEAVERQLGARFAEPVTLVWLPRLLGHGGFVLGEMYVSYLDRNYAGGDPEMVIRHELAHVLDNRREGDWRPLLLVEGLAVYLAGGHFKPEPLLPRAAALLDLGLYLPLGPLSDDFYLSQHEIGYLQAGALVDFMVQTWGWPAFDAFYRDIQPHASGRASRALDVALQEHFGLSLTALEARYLEFLRAYPANPDLLADVRLTVRYYDAVRLYQQVLDPEAYFLNAWLPGVGEMQARGLVADYLRHPSRPENLALESLLVQVGDRLRGGQFSQAERLLGAVERVLRAHQTGHPAPFQVDRLAEDALAVVRTLVQFGYQPQQVELDGDRVFAWVGAPGEGLRGVSMERQGESWILR